MEGYNGWTNRATWVVNLHFGDDTDTIEEMVKDADGDLYTVVDSIKAWVQDYIDEMAGDNSFIRDLLADHEIDYYDLAKAWIGDYKPEEEEEEEEE